MDRSLVRESEWMRVYGTSQGQLQYESKFLRNGLHISVDQIQKKWPSMSEEERCEFSLAFTAKCDWSAEDASLLRYLMEAGDESVADTIAMLVARHCTSKDALNFLLNRIERKQHGRANYYQALRIVNDKSVVPHLRAIYERLRASLKERGEVSTDYQDYLHCCAALWELDGSPEFESVLHQFKTHSDADVSVCAKLLLAKDA